MCVGYKQQYAILFIFLIKVKKEPFLSHRETCGILVL